MAFEALRNQPRPIPHPLEVLVPIGICSDSRAPVVTVLPHGKTTVGYLTPHGTDRYDPLEGIEREGGVFSSSAREPDRVALSLDDRFKILCDAVASEALSPEKEAYALERLTEVMAAMDAPSPPSPIGLSNALNYHKPSETLPKERRGQGGITCQGKNTVAAGVYVLEQTFPGELAFITVTTPPLPDEVYDVHGELYSEYRRRVEQELTRELKRHGVMDPWYVSVVEIQEKRFAAYGRPYLHLHVLIHCWSEACGYHGFGKTRKKWPLTPEWIEEMTGRTFEAVFGMKPDWGAATEIRKARGGMNREMSKYMSKGGRCIRKVKEAGYSHILPSSWYGISRPLLQLTRENTIRLTGEYARMYLDALEERAERGECRYWRVMQTVAGFNPFTREATSHEVVAGYVVFEAPTPIGRTREKPADIRAANLSHLVTPPLFPLWRALVSSPI